MKKWLQALLFYAGFPIAAVSIWIQLILVETLTLGWFMTGIVPAATVICYTLLRKKLSLRFAAKCNAAILIVLSVCLAISLFISTGSIRSGAFACFRIITFPFLIPSLIMDDNMLPAFIMIFLTYAAAMIACIILMRTQKDATESDTKPIYCRVLPYLLTFIIVLLCGAFSLKQYYNRPEVRYAGHGFDYMNGYSSTDFTDYTVYSTHSKLITLDHQPELIIENEKDMPVMDGVLQYRSDRIECDQYGRAIYKWQNRFLYQYRKGILAVVGRRS